MIWLLRLLSGFIEQNHLSFEDAQELHSVSMGSSCRLENWAVMSQFALEIYKIEYCIQ